MEADRNRRRRRHDQPLTRAAQLLRWSDISRENRQRIEALEQQCDPMALLETIRWNQAALVNGESKPSTETDRSASNQELNAFLSSLLLLWRQSAATARGWIPCTEASRRCNGWSGSTLVCISAACASCRRGWVSDALPMPNRWLTSRWGQSETRKQPAQQQEVTADQVSTRWVTNPVSQRERQCS